MKKMAMTIWQTLQRQDIALQAMTPCVVANQNKLDIFARAGFQA